LIASLGAAGASVLFLAFAGYMVVKQRNQPGSILNRMTGDQRIADNPLYSGLTLERHNPLFEGKGASASTTMLRDSSAVLAELGGSTNTL